jgi:hypothetical protein
MSKRILPRNKFSRNTRRAVGKRHRNSPRTKVLTVSLQELGPEGGIIKLSELLAEDGGDDAVNMHLGNLADKWPDFQFATEDGRTFAFVYDSNSDDLIVRIDTANMEMTTEPERKRLKKVEAAIVELKSNGYPIDESVIKFDSWVSGLKAWFELRRSFGVPITRELERSIFDVLREAGDLGGDSEDWNVVYNDEDAEIDEADEE